MVAAVVTVGLWAGAGAVALAEEYVPTTVSVRVPEPAYAKSTLEFEVKARTQAGEPVPDGVVEVSLVDPEYNWFEFGNERGLTGPDGKAVVAVPVRWRPGTYLVKVELLGSTGGGHAPSRVESSVTLVPRAGRIENVSVPAVLTSGETAPFAATLVYDDGGQLDDEADVALRLRDGTGYVDVQTIGGPNGAAYGERAFSAPPGTYELEVANSVAFLDAPLVVRTVEVRAPNPRVTVQGAQVAWRREQVRYFVEFGAPWTGLSGAQRVDLALVDAQGGTAVATSVVTTPYPEDSEWGHASLHLTMPDVAGTYSIVATWRDPAGTWPDVVWALDPVHVSENSTSARYCGPASGRIGSTVPLCARVTGSSGPSRGAPVTVALRRDGADVGSWSLVTDDNGEARVTVETTSLAAGRYEVVVTAPRYDVFDAASGTGTLDLTRAASRLTMTAATTVAYGGSFLVSGQLLDGSTSMPGRTVTVTFSNAGAPRAVSVVTGADGGYRATFTADGGGGPQRVTATYAGSATDEPAVVERTVDVTGTASAVTYTGMTAGVAGTYARVSGTITPQPPSAVLVFELVDAGGTVRSSVTAPVAGGTAEELLPLPARAGVHTLRVRYAGRFGWLPSTTSERFDVLGA